MLVLLLWLAGIVQVGISLASLILPRKLDYAENLRRVTPIIRQIFIVHSAYIVGVVLLFAAITFGFARDLASGRGLGRFLSSTIAIFWICRVPVQFFYYDASVRRSNRLGDILFGSAALFLAIAYGMAALSEQLA
jgi:vacuolar-type H+-ATPase subunit I/STV1